MWEIDLLEKNLPLFKLNIMTISNLSFLGKAMLWVQIISAGFSPFQDDDIPHFLKVFFENLPLHAFYSCYILIFFKIYLLVAFWRFNLYYFLYGNWFQKFWVFIILFFLYRRITRFTWFILLGKRYDFLILSIVNKLSSLL